MAKTKDLPAACMQGINNWVKTVLQISGYLFPESVYYLFADLCG
jgi:hypothetical protein